MPSPPPAFALLDDCQAEAATPSSRLYTDYVHQRICIDSAHWEAVCEAVEADLQAGLHAVVLAEYEWGVQLHLHKDTQHLAPYAAFQTENEHTDTEKQGRNAAKSTRPAACRFLLFRECAHLSQQAVQAWLEHAADKLQNEAPPPSLSGVTQIQTSCSEAEFTRTFDSIQQALQAGEMYQMNFTYRLYFEALGSPFALYSRLRTRQPTAYGALIALPTGEWILSFSPELFLQNQKGKLTAKPMKGTAARLPDTTDNKAAADLAASPKNRAENVMIVDLLRNDISQVAQLGSVQVPSLFNVEPYGSVWQMSSTIEARLQKGTTFAQIMRALFPCGSITGAPKHRAMQWIRALENRPRGLYTGAIGWLEAAPPTASSSAVNSNAFACGNFCLSVAIRTLVLEPTPESRHWKGSLGIGAGIVLDSTAEEEWKECGLKARFLTQLDPGFTLLETMYATREQGIRHARRHARRLRRAAQHFGFVWQPRQMYSQLQAAIAALPAMGVMQPFKIRLTLDALGLCALSTEVLSPAPTEPVPVLLASALGLGSAFEAPAEYADAPCSFPPPITTLSSTSPSNSTDYHLPPLWLQYKTSFRPHYTQALKLTEAHGVFDLLFVNPAGELTEGARTNLFLKLEGSWFTPPTSCGALPGVMRAVLLEDPHFQATERVLTLTDLYRAEAILICNALRGPLSAYLKTTSPPSKAIETFR